MEPLHETTALYESIRDKTLIVARRPRAPATHEEPPAQTLKGYKLYDYCREPDGAYLVMRLMKGGSLDTLLDRSLASFSRNANSVSKLAKP